MTTARTAIAPTAPPGTEAASAGSRPAGTLLAAGRDQAVVAAGQLLAGVGNLAFVAVSARLLPRGQFGDVAGFIALLTLLHVPAGGLAAAGAVGRGEGRGLARWSTWSGVALGAALAISAAPVGDVVGLPPTYLLALAAAAPAAPLLGLARGVAYGRRDHRAVVSSLLVEPAARLVLGLGLALIVGGAGAAWGAVVGSWLALWALRRRVAQGAHVARAVETVGAGATGLAFVGLAILQHQDLLLANGLLDPAAAGSFAALSTLGGLVVFATATLPLVLLPSAEVDDRSGLVVAAGTALAVAAGAVGLGLVAAEHLVLAVVGSRYVAIAPLVPPYLAAMGALGVARVLAAHRCAAGGGRKVAWIVGTISVAHAAAIVALARTPGQVAAATTMALVATAGTMALPAAWRPQATARWRQRIAAWAGRPDARLLVVATVAAVALRLATERSLWIDEAVSINQAQMPFGGMLDNLRGTDVHPPLHHIVLWVTVRALGTGEWAMRLPSVLFGAALVPVLYGTARAAFDRPTARVVAVLAVPAPFLVWYSQEVRMYSLFMLVGVAGVWAQVVALRTGRIAAYAAWGVASAALLWTQWFAVLPLAVQHLAAVLHLVRARGVVGVAGRAVRGWGLTIAITAVLVAPLVPYLLDQLAAYSERGKGLAMPSAAGTDNSSVADGLSSYALIANVVWALAGYHSDDVMTRLGSLWPLAMLGGLLLLGRRLQRSTRLLVAVALVPAVALYLIGHTKRDLFELRYFVLAAPLLLLVVARSVTTATRTRLAAGLLTAGLLAVSSAGLVDQQLNGTNPRLYDFRGAVAEIHRTSEPGDVLAHAPSYLDGVLGYYTPALETVPLGALEEDEVDGQIYVVVAERFLTGGTSGAVGDVLAGLEAARGEPERFERPNVVVWRFP